VRNINREQASIELSRAPFSARQHASAASRAYLAAPTTQEHMSNDDLIIGLNFEAYIEGKR
jgi:hypothetical protein